MPSNSANWILEIKNNFLLQSFQFLILVLHSCFQHMQQNTFFFIPYQYEIHHHYNYFVFFVLFIIWVAVWVWFQSFQFPILVLHCCFYHMQQNTWPLPADTLQVSCTKVCTRIITLFIYTGLLLSLFFFLNWLLS